MTYTIKIELVKRLIGIGPLASHIQFELGIHPRIGLQIAESSDRSGTQELKFIQIGLSQRQNGRCDGVSA